MSNLLYSVTMLSDWHVGSGAGLHASVDRLVRRDAEGFPYVPAKTMTGIWRDACETVAFGLDDSEHGAWSAWVAVLFGSQPPSPIEDADVAADAVGPARFASPASRWDQSGPRAAAVSIRSAHYGATFRAMLRDRPRLRAALTFVKPGVAIDPLTGRAEDEKLRFIEMARAGARLDGRIAIDDEEWSEEQRTAACALLVAGAEFVDRLGGKRRRGSGRCKLSILRLADAPGQAVAFGTLDAGWAADVLERQMSGLPAAPAVRAAEIVVHGSAMGIAVDAVAHGHTPPDDGWTIVPIEITALSSLCIPARTVGNVVETLDYIPGGSLVPIILRAMRPGTHGIDVDAELRRGHIIVTNATPSVGGVPGRPVPRSLVHEKGDRGLNGGTVINRLWDASDSVSQQKAHKHGYVGRVANAGGQLTYVETSSGSTTHNSVDDAVQRPTSRVGGVYTYEYLAPGTIFLGQVRLRTSVATVLGDGWRGRLAERTQRVGRAKKDEYGEIAVASEAPFVMANMGVGGATLVVWLLSDVLIRDSRLRLSTSQRDFTRVLGDALGVTLTVRSDEKRLSWLMGPSRRDSWHAGWQLPRPTLLGFAAGGVAVLESDKPIAADLLARVAVEGIGERRGEGFGQLTFGDSAIMPVTNGSGRTDAYLEHTEAPDVPPTAGLEDDRSPTLPTRSFGDEEAAHLLTIEMAAWRMEIMRAAEVFAADSARRGSVIVRDGGKPSAAQLGTLRSLIGQIRGDDVSIVTRWLEHVRGNARARERWPEGALKAIEALLEPEVARGKMAVWLKLEPSGANFAGAADDRTDALRDALWAEALRALVVACIRADTREWQEPRPPIQHPEVAHVE